VNERVKRLGLNFGREKVKPSLIRQVGFQSRPSTVGRSFFHDLSLGNFGYGHEPNDVSRLHIDKNKAWFQ
jgi:hypothetical protein